MTLAEVAKLKMEEKRAWYMVQALGRLVARHHPRQV
jgi:hypothetical protein